MPLSVGSIESVVVVGAGVMGEGIAQSFAEAGLQVCVVDIESSALQRCVAQIESNLALSVRYDVVTEPVARIMSRIAIAPAESLSAVLESCDVAIETSPEVLEIKQGLFAQFDQAPENVLIASNTSSFTITQLTEGMSTPQRVVGLHYFNPAHIIPAVEVHFGENTDESAIELASALMTRVGKTPVLVRKETPGFIINRLTGALSREIDFMLDEGIVAPEDLDAAVKASLGFRLAQIGPMEGKDFIGLDTDVRVSRNVFPGLSNRTEPSRFVLGKVAQGDLGVKSGRGVFDYSGRSREEVLRERNVRLLEQRRLYIESYKGSDT